MTSPFGGEAIIPSDPVIEYYKQFVDRAALRENLKLTPTERLEKLQRRMNEGAREAERPLHPRAAPVVREVPPAYGRDAIVEAYKKDVDRTLLRENLRLTVEQRLEKLQGMAEFFHEIHGVARRGHPLR
jgi:hypothetical protein